MSHGFRSVRVYPFCMHFRLESVVYAGQAPEIVVWVEVFIASSLLLLFGEH